MSTILMVDDAGLFQLLETSFLRRTGCRIVRATDHEDCLAKSRSVGPDLIILAADHPGLGVDCIRELKADPRSKSIPILVVTVQEAVEGCAEAGADKVLSRPVSRDDLVTALESFGCVARRTGKRRTARMPAQMSTAEGERRGRVKDISRTGLFVAMPKPLPIDESVDLSLRVRGPKGDRNVRARGVVVRQVAENPDSHLIAGVGVRFTKLDPATESLLDYFVGQAILGVDPLESDDGGKGQA